MMWKVNENIDEFIFMYKKSDLIKNSADISKNNKKVLLRERKRHTARRVASNRCVPGPGGGLPGLRSGGGGYPVLGLGGALPGPRSGGVPGPRSRGVPGPRSGGYPIPGLGGTLGTPSTWTWDGVPPLPRPEMG